MGPPIPVTEIQFPAIAICEFNKISKQRATDLARQLSTVSSLDVDTLLNLTRLLGNLYDYNNFGADDFESLQSMLDQLDEGTSEGDLVRRLASLITPCTDLLHNCSWNSVAYSCSDLFQTRFTDSGLCCVFNYVRDTPETAFIFENTSATPWKLRLFMGAGVSKGLSVTIANNISDYFYSSMATRGALLKIFLPLDFPDLPSGSLKQIIVQERSEVFVDIAAKKLNTSSASRSLSVRRRKCKFSDEDQTAFGSYTYSNCLVQCRLHCIVTLCHCIPVMLPVSAQSFKNSVSFCNLKDLPCLNRFQGKWLRYFPLEDPHAQELSFEFEDSLYCESCMPNCDDTFYEARTNYIEFFNEDSNYRNSSRLHVYSGKNHSKYYKKMATMTWFESLSTIGGIISILLGVSIINLVEIAVVAFKLVCTILWK